MTICKNTDCKKHASYGKPGTKIKLYCPQHALVGMVDVAHKLCLEDNCDIRASYGKSGTKKAEYCQQHAKAGMVDVMSKRCIHENCDIRANYGKSGTKKAEYCSTHAKAGMVDITHKRCKHENCDIRANYGKSGTKIKLYCQQHAKAGMVDVVSKRCIHENCDIRAGYGKPGTKKAEYCSTHAKAGMVDITHKRCIHENCDTRASYGKPGYSPEYCASHKHIGMICDPKKTPKTEVKECQFCLLPIHYNENFCSGCKNYVVLGATKKRHNKELAIKHLLEQHQIEFIHDKIVDSKCSRRRPDFQINTWFGAIILEVDENQHCRKSYPCECEVSRMKQIYMDMGLKHLIFVRYNPDKYKPASGNQYNKIKREDYLIKYIKDIMKEKDVKPEWFLGSLYLFYDMFLPDNIAIDIVNPYDS